MKERDIQTLFRKHIETYSEFQCNTVWELKLSKDNSIPFSKVQPHQIEGLSKAKTEGVFVKLMDMPHFRGMKTRFDSKKPFDCLFIKSNAYVVICFYKPRKPKNTYLIDIDTFIQEKNNSSRKSLTEIRASEIAEKIIVL